MNSKLNVHDLLHKRALVIVNEPSRYGAKQAVEEIKFLEISPSANWVKIQNMHGNKFWKATSDINPIEVLASLNTDKPV